MKKNPMFKLMIQTFLFWLFVAFIFNLFISCGSTKKHKEKEITESSVATKTDVSQDVKIKTEDKSKEQTKVSEEATDECLEVKVKDGEELEITNFDANGNKTGSTKFSGSGVAKKSKGSKKTETNTIKETNIKTDVSAQLDVSTRTDASKASKKATVKVDKKGFSFCAYLFCIVLVIIVLTLWYLNKRFKWVFKLINLFNKKL